MEQHPVPQNVTTFQFRLIGDMTIKQFGYLAGGAILAYISYKLPLPFFFTWPMTILFAVGGVGFAFVPIEERPMDIWVMAFLKNIYSPTLYVWEKSSAPAVQTPQPAVVRTVVQPVRAQSVQPMQTPPPPVSVTPQQSRTKADIVGSVFSPPAPRQAPLPPVAAPIQRQAPMQQPTVPMQKNAGLFGWLGSLFSFSAPATAPAVSFQSAAPIANPSITGARMDFSLPPTVTAPSKTPPPQVAAEAQKKEAELAEKMKELKHELETTSMTETRILELQKQLTEVLAQKDKMEAEVLTLRRQAANPASAPAAPTPATTAPAPAAPVSHTKQPTVKIITPEGAVRAGLPRLTTFPNVVTGITKDSDNNMLPGVLVTVKDKDGIPVRALKTNRLGQFAASTPLSNGVYFVEIEDPRGRYAFDRVQITLNGSIVPALEIIAKSMREISRAKLAAEIFGNQTP